LSESDTLGFILPLDAYQKSLSAIVFWVMGAAVRYCWPGHSRWHCLDDPDLVPSGFMHAGSRALLLPLFSNYVCMLERL